MSGPPRDPAMAKVDAEFQGLVAKMNTPESHNGTETLFSATAADLGKAAVRGARLDNERSGASAGQANTIGQS